VIGLAASVGLKGSHPRKWYLSRDVSSALMGGAWRNTADGVYQ